MRPSRAPARSREERRPAHPRCAVAQLIQEEERARPLRIGDTAPEFSLQAYGGEQLTSTHLLRSGPLIVTFYRDFWCPYCQRDLRAVGATLVSIEELGATAVASTRPRGQGGDTPPDHDLGLAFPVLEDRAGDLAVRFGIRWSSDELNMISTALGSNLATFRSTEPWIVPMQARFVLDRQGVVAFAEAAFDYDDCSDPSALLPLLAELRKQTSVT